MVVIVMGVSSCGKSTIGRGVAERLGWGFSDGDDFHPPENVAKMKSGLPLNDQDRAPWLKAIRAQMDRDHAAGKGAVVACSALKEAYREILGCREPWVRIVHLTGTRELLEERIKARTGHFMPPSLLASQLSTLESPRDAWVYDVSNAPAKIVDDIVGRIRAEQDCR